MKWNQDECEIFVSLPVVPVAGDDVQGGCTKSSMHLRVNGKLWDVNLSREIVPSTFAWQPLVDGTVLSARKAVPYREWSSLTDPDAPDAPSTNVPDGSAPLLPGIEVNTTLAGQQAAECDALVDEGDRLLTDGLVASALNRYSEALALVRHSSARVSSEAGLRAAIQAAVAYVRNRNWAVGLAAAADAVRLSRRLGRELPLTACLAGVRANLGLGHTALALRGAQELAQKYPTDERVTDMVRRCGAQLSADDASQRGAEQPPSHPSPSTPPHQSDRTHRPPHSTSRLPPPRYQSCEACNATVASSALATHRTTCAGAPPEAPLRPAEFEAQPQPARLRPCLRCSAWYPADEGTHVCPAGTRIVEKR